MTDIETMVHVNRALWDDCMAADKAASDKRRKYGLQSKQLEQALIKQSGYKEGDELKTTDGTQCWIAWLSLATTHHSGEMKLIAHCYRMLKSGQKSKRPDMAVALWRCPRKETAA